MGKELKKAPRFKNEDEEFEFWSAHDITDYVDVSKSKRLVFPNLKPSAKPVFIRLPRYLLDHLKLLAHKKDIPYQSLMKVYLAEKVEEELGTIPGLGQKKRANFLQKEQNVL